METKQIITFHYGKDCNRPRSVEGSCNLFCLYAPEEIFISGNKLKTVNLQTKVILPPKLSYRRLKKRRVYIQNNGIVHSGGWLKMKY